MPETSTCPITGDSGAVDSGIGDAAHAPEPSPPSKTEKTPAAGSRPFTQLAGPEPMPIVGWRGNAARFLTRPLQYMNRLRGRFGNVSRLVAGGNAPIFSRPFDSPETEPSTVLAFGEEANRAILTQLDIFVTRHPRGPGSEEFEAISDNILFWNGERHKDARKLLMPIFSRGNLQAYHGIMVDYAREMLAGWRQGQVVDISEEMSLVSMRIASKCLYGLDPAKESEDLAERMRDMMSALFSPVVLVPLDIPGSPYRRLLRDIRDIHASLETLIAASRDDPGGADILAIMIRRHLEERGRIDVTELLGNAFVFFFAGHDTTSRALTWTLLLLAQHPEVMAELMQELDENLEDDVPTYGQLFELPVLDRVVKESMRVLAPSFLFPRVTAVDAVLCGYEIPAGTEVIYSPYMTHTDPRLFEDPNRFDPDRWKTIKPSPYAYLPFGAGRRTCIGAALGTMTVKLLLPIIVRAFRLQAMPRKIDLDFHAVIGPKGGLPMRLHPQDRRFAESAARITGDLAQMVHWPDGGQAAG
ncbi:MAG: cytochrome P450 [Holophagales bacterium]|nr:cytochrome P450 [Holophagales bacterium]